MYEQLTRHNSTPALFLPDGTTIDYAHLVRESEQVAEGLAAVGVGPRSIVVVAQPNGPDFLAALLGCWLVGAVFAPVSPALTPTEFERVLAVSAPHLILAHPTSRVLRSPALQSGKRVETPRPSDIHWVQLAAPDDGSTVDDEDRLVLFTSGSTGDPKGVRLTSENLVAGVRAVLGTTGLGPTDKSVALLPWTHGHGLIGQVLSSMTAGASLVVPATPNLVESGVFTCSPTWLTMVPPQLSVLCETASTVDSRVASLRFVRTASAPLTTSAARRAESVFDCPVAEAYGMTESSHQAAANAPTYEQRRLGTVGLPTGVQIRINRSDDELEVRGDSVFKGYLGRADLTEQVIDADGWYRTGDVAEVTPDGHIKLCGRLNELINRGGFKISPIEVEEALAMHPGVRECLATAIKDPVLGQDIAVLAVVNEQAPTVAELKSHCREHLSAGKQPAKIRVVTELPRLANGKPSRRLAVGVLEDAVRPDEHAAARARQT
jgi:acyl-CoA synthetase (AMP-forming)/AMP-acid ligase II